MNEQSYTDIFYKVYRVYQFILMFHGMKDPMKKKRLTEYYTYHYATAAAAKQLQSCLTLCNPIDGSPSGSSVPGILQARILEWVAISFSNTCMHSKSLQSCLTLCDPHGQQPTRLLHPWDSPGKNTEVPFPSPTYHYIILQIKTSEIFRSKEICLRKIY